MVLYIHNQIKYMPTFYKSNAAVKGALLGLSTNIKDGDGALFINVVKQSAYDSTRRIGQFQGEKIAVKLSIFEVGNLLDVITNNRPFSTVHRNSYADEKTMTQIYFEPFVPENKETKEKGEQKGFALRIIRGESKFFFGFSFGEAMVLRSFFDYFLRQTFSNEQLSAKKAYKDKQEKAQSAPKSPKSADSNESEEIE